MAGLGSPFDGFVGLHRTARRNGVERRWVPFTRRVTTVDQMRSRRCGWKPPPFVRFTLAHDVDAHAHGRTPDHVHFPGAPSVIVVAVVIGVVLGMIRGKIVNVRFSDRAPLPTEG